MLHRKHFFWLFLSSLKCLWCSRLHISDLRVVEHCLPLATSIPMHSIQRGAEESMRRMNNKIWTLKQAFFLFDLHFLHPMGNLTSPLFKVAQVIIWYDEFGVGFKNAVTIPHICHFFYTDRIFENHILHPKNDERHQKH